MGRWADGLYGRFSLAAVLRRPWADGSTSKILRGGQTGRHPDFIQPTNSSRLLIKPGKDGKKALDLISSPALLAVAAGDSRMKVALNRARMSPFGGYVGQKSKIGKRPPKISRKRGKFDLWTPRLVASLFQLHLGGFP